MKRKFVTNTYLRGVDNYILMQFEDNALDCYTVIKKVNSIDKPYISTHTGKGICLLKEGYYMVEYLPKNENYGVRVFLDDNKDTISYLFLDITIDKVNGDIVNVWDEDELQKALDEKDITKNQYDMAYTVLKNVLNQIANNSNKYINNDHKEYIDKNFK